MSLALEVEGREDIVVDLQTSKALEQLKHTPFTIKEGAQYRMKVKFRVQRQVLSGMKYLQVVRRKGIRVAKDEEMIVSSFLKGFEPSSRISLWVIAERLCRQGSYPPSTENNPFYETKCSYPSLLVLILTGLAKLLHQTDTSRVRAECSCHGRSTDGDDGSWSLRRRLQVRR